MKFSILIEVRTERYRISQSMARLWKIGVVVAGTMLSWSPSYVVAATINTFTGGYAVPASPPAGTVLLRDYVSSRALCVSREACTARRFGLYPKSGSVSGSLIPTSVTGISVRMLVNGIPMTHDGGSGTVIDKPVELQLVADGPQITGGSLKSLNSFGFYFNFDSKEASVTVTLDLTGTITAIRGTCSVPSQTVTLPSITARKFDGVGSTAGTQPFQLRVNDCPRGYNQVGYSLSPAGGMVAGTPGVLPLGANSTARGAKIRVADGNGVPVSFNQSITIGAYEKSMGGSYSIPMQASYIQTDTTVTVGTVQGAMVVTMEYR